MRSRRGFTLIEALIVMAILTILGALVYPKLADLTADVPVSTMSATVRQIREQINYHAAIGDVPLSFEGFPSIVDEVWFAKRDLPPDAWTYEPLKIQVVHGPKNADQPNKKSFNVKPNGTAAGHTAWYNAANGSFCALVPRRGSEDEIRDAFILVNGVSGVGSG